MGRVSRVRHIAMAEQEGLTVYRQPVNEPDPQKGTYHEPVPLPDATWQLVRIGKPAAGHLVWADFDGDGSDELVSGSGDLTLYKLLEADGKWRAKEISTGVESTRLIAGDLNGDSKAELIAGDSSM